MNIKISIGHITTIFSIIIYMIFPCEIFAQKNTDNCFFPNKKGFISIINTHSPSTPWSEKMIDKLLSSEMVTSYEISLLPEHMHIQVISSLEEVEMFKKSVISRQKSYSDDLRLILFIGLDGFVFFEKELKTIWKDIPVVVASLEEHIEPVEYYISKRVAPKSKWIEFKNQTIHDNTVFIHHSQYFIENIEIMKKMMPQMESLTLLSSHQHSSAVTRQRMQDAISKYYPDILFKNFIEGEIQSDEVISVLHEYNPEKDGVIYFSWQQHRNPDGNVRIISQAYKFISRLTRQPIFNLVDVGIENGGMIGGYISSAERLNTNMITIIEQMLEGKKSYELSNLATIDPQYIFNYISFIENGISPDNIPSNSIIYNEPESNIKKYIFHIIAIIFIIILIIFSIYTYMLLKQKTVNDEKIKLLNKHKYLFNNMPIPYSSIKVIRNNKSEIVNYKIEEVNPAFQNLFPNYKSFINKEGKDIHPESFNSQINQIKEVINSDDNVSYNEFQISSKKIIKSFLKKSSENSIGVFYIDNTELYKALNDANAANQLKSAFLANMSHEIRTPLNAIVGFSELILTSATESEKIEYGQIIENNSNILLNLINDILDLSKIEAGYIDLYKEDFDLVNLINDLCSTFSFRMKEEVKLLTCIPFQHYIINWDKKRITQIITNFMTNAIKFTKKGYIEMGFYSKDKGIVIYVKDTGIGIKDIDKNKIFERFEKINEFAQGTGLGMSICKAIIDSYGGEIGFDSEEGKGSNFWVYIPCVIKFSDNTKKEKIESSNSDFIYNKKFNILIAEDNESNYKLISTILKNKIGRAHV